MRIVLPVLALAAAVAVAVVIVAGDGSSASAQTQSVTVTMGAGRDASQTGTATLTAQGNQTQVVVNIQSGGAGVEQPAHVHEGTCPGVGAVAYALSNVVDGQSTTLINATLASLQTGGFSVNVHKGTSSAELGVYVSCGVIPVAAQATPTPTATGTASPTATPASAVKTGGRPSSGDGTASWHYLLIAAGGLAVLGGGILALRYRQAR
ncbi:MAG: hypothetical protein HYY03_00295 [Chloroflexi bacterium]|nr:hypothetical protein [Chloroflexota bacterium]